MNFNVTSHPTAGWIIQQLREAFPYQSAPRFLIFDRDAKYGLEVPIAVRSMAIRPVRTSFQSPWQGCLIGRMWTTSEVASLKKCRRKNSGSSALRTKKETISALATVAIPRWADMRYLAALTLGAQMG